MRKICHISHSSHEEVMFRSEEDINYYFNCFALACLETESRPLADSEMTTHTHHGVATDSPREVSSRTRYAYSRYFNAKYERRGRLGERDPFILETEGLHHTQAMLSYVNRQGLHHGLSASPFGYKYNSVNVIFRNELGKTLSEETIPRHRWSPFLPHGVKDIPEGYRMSKSGILLREDVIDTSYVEEVYLTPRNFLFQMNRLSGEDWRKEQEEDKNNRPPVTLSDLEPHCYQPSMTVLLSNENGRNASDGITDLELCRIIDMDYLAQIGKTSIYELNDSQRDNLGNAIFHDIKNGTFTRKLGRNAGLPDVAQIRRCIAIKP